MTGTTEETNTETPISNRLRKRKKPDMEKSNNDHSLAQKQVIPSSPKKKKNETHSLPTIQQKQQMGSVKIPVENKVLSSKTYSPKCNTTKTKQKSVSATSLSKCLEASKPKHPKKCNKIQVENEEEGKRNKVHKRKKPDVQIYKLDQWLIQKGVIPPLPNKKIKANSLPMLSITTEITQDEKFVKTIEETNTENPIPKRIQKRKEPDLENLNGDQRLAQKEVIQPSPKKKKIKTLTSPRLSTIMQQKQYSEPVKTPVENLVQKKVMSNKKYSPKNTTNNKPSNKQRSLSKCLEASKPKHPNKDNKTGAENEEEGKRNKLHTRKKPDVQISELDHQLTLQEVIPLSPKKKKIETRISPRLSTIMQQKQHSVPVTTPVKNLVQDKIMSNKKYSPKHTRKNKQKSVLSTSLSKYLEASKLKHPKKDNKKGVENEKVRKTNKLHRRKKTEVQISELDHPLIYKGVIRLSPHNEKIEDCSLSKLFINMQEKLREPMKTRVRNLVPNKVMSNKKYSPKHNTTKNKHKSVSPTSSSKYLEASKTKQPRKVSKLVTEKTSNKTCPPKTKGKEKKQSTLNLYLAKNNTKTFRRNDSFESVDLPTFSNVTKKKPTKSSKLKEQKASFQKYGVILPTVEEILKDMKDVENRRNKIKSFNPISEDSLELPFSNEILQKPAKEKGLDCKHLTLDELTTALNFNASFLSDIINEKISNNRHQRYFNKNLKVLTMTSNDLTYNTSTIVFSYEQIDHLMSLLKQQFDPDDTKTKYFFQVLLPELCLRIFMKTYEMNLEQAVKYLGERPLID